MAGSSEPEDVARAVVKAIKRDHVESIVNSTPLRPMLAVGELFPSLYERMTRTIGVSKLFNEWKDAPAEAKVSR